MPSDSMDQVHDTRTMCCHDHLPRDHDHKLIHPCHNNKDFHRNSFRLNVILLLILTINCVFLPQESDGSLRHHRDHVRNFSCGKLFYRTLSVSKDVMFVGAMDRIFRIPMANINRTRCEIDSLPIGPDNGEHCVSKGKSGHYECRNHVRVIQVIDHGSKLYVCGTNAHSPKDWILDSNSLQMLDPSNFPGIGNGIAKCPFDPEDNSTAVWVERGNPEGAPGLYSGSVAEFTKADTVIFRSDLYNMTTGQKVHPFKRTVKYDSKWLDKPNFVGSFEVGEYVYFFFRESAVEFINCGKNIYSRVARVCKRDMGGKNILSKNWASFLKARLNCSIPGEFPFYFNEIQHVFRHPDSQRSDSGYGFDGDSDNPNAAKFYAVFSTSSNGLTGSAICSFSLDSITEVFNGKFKEQATSSSAWLPVLNSKVPEPRPGVCMNDTQSLPDSVLNFIRAHPLMDSAVPHDNSRPIFFKRDVIFTKIVVDFRTIENPFGGGDPLEYTIYYAGTSTGLVYKIVEWKNNHNHPPLHHPHNHNPSSSSSSSSSSYNYNHQYYRSAQSDQAAPDTSSSSSSGGSEGSPLPSTSNSHLVDIFDATSPEPIRAMELSSKYKSLYVASDSHIRQFDLYTCKTRYETCMRCSRDPYCGWDKNHGECKPYSKGLTLDVENSNPSACDDSIKIKEIKATFGQTLYLKSPSRISELVKLGYYQSSHTFNSQPKWYYSRSISSSSLASHHMTEVAPRRDKFILTNDGGLVIMGTSDSETGRYECRVGPAGFQQTVLIYSVSVDAKTCTVPTESDYVKLYSDWCNEVERYKQLLKNWQTRQSKCQSGSGSSGTNGASSP